jgi:hypothetical protein
MNGLMTLNTSSPQLGEASLTPTTPDFSVGVRLASPSPAQPMEPKMLETREKAP